MLSGSATWCGAADPTALTAPLARRRIRPMPPSRGRHRAKVTLTKVTLAKVAMAKVAMAKVAMD